MLFSDVEGSTALLSRLGTGTAKPCRPSARFSAPCSASSAATRWAPRETASSSCSTPPPTRSAVAWQRSVTWPATTGPAASACGPGWACTPASPPGMRMGTSGSMFTGRPDRGSRARRPGGGVRRDAAAGRFPPARRRLLPRPGFPPAERHRGTGTHLPARRCGPGGAVPAVAEPGAATSFPVPMTSLVGRGDELAALAPPSPARRPGW